jgi:hypothetical protein
MKCPACGAEVVEGSKSCAACGKELPFMKRAEGETAHLAKKTGAVAGKVGRGLVEGAKGFGSGVKKGYKGTADEEKKDSSG